MALNASRVCDQSSPASKAAAASYDESSPASKTLLAHDVEQRLHTLRQVRAVTRLQRWCCQHVWTKLSA